MSTITAALKPRSVLVATDFSEASEKALRHSLALARFFGSKFCLAHVVSSVGLTIAGPGAIAACEEAVLRETAQLEGRLIRTGALTGIQHKFIVRQGELWPQLKEVIREENTDLMVVGTHGRHGMAKLFFGSRAEQIFRQADCRVLTFGPYSRDALWYGTSSARPTFLFATDFGHASVRGLPHAIAAANQFGARLAFLSIVPAVSRDEDVSIWHGDPRQRSYERLCQLAGPVSEKILETAEKVKADLIIMGLHESPYGGVISHLDLGTTYAVVCNSSSPVLTVSCSSAPELRPLADTEHLCLGGEPM